jgi:hypothetical protein
MRDAGYGIRDSGCGMNNRDGINIEDPIFNKEGPR